MESKALTRSESFTDLHASEEKVLLSRTLRVCASKWMQWVRSKFQPINIGAPKPSDVSMY